jgi:hypothetical protein
MQIGDGHVEALLHPPDGVHTQQLDLVAAVRLSAPARPTLAAMQIRIDRTPVADRHRWGAGGWTKREYFNPQFVTENARVVEEGLLSTKGVQIGAADADPPDLHQGHPCPRWWRGGRVL